MKNFIRDTLVTLAIGLVLAWVLSLAKPNYEKLNNFTYKRYFIEHNADSIKILLLGNSLFENGINPHVLGDSVFDLAISARITYYDVVLAQRYFPSMKNLKVCLFPMGYNLSLDPTSHQYACIRDHYIWMDIEPPTEYCDKVTKKPWLHYTLFRNARSCDAAGYDTLLSDKNLEKIELTQYRTDEFRKHLTTLAQICTDKGVRLVVITPPCYLAAIDGISSEGIELMHTVVDSVASLYPIEYKDYLCDSTFQKKELYFNANHLNHQGATLFAQRVKDDLGL